VIVDLKNEGDRALLRRMIARADVFLQNLAPGAIARAGFDPAELRRVQPRLICCSITGYGESGPYRDMKAYDFLIQAETGLASVTGHPEAPARVGVSVSDVAAGLNAHAAILQALVAREHTGDGALIHVSMFDATAEWMSVPFMNLAYTGKAPARVGLMHPSIAPYGAYTCADGKDIVIGIQNEREWVRFCAEVLADAALASDPRFCDMERRVGNRAALEAIVSAAFAKEVREALGKRLKAAEIAFGNLNTVADFAKHPQLRLGEVATIAGAITMPYPPALATGAPMGKVPALGEHNAAIRREFA
jgi:itaconate CoA-transferase